jgi:hypothetical protein
MAETDCGCGGIEENNGRQTKTKTGRDSKEGQIKVFVEK